MVLTSAASSVLCKRHINLLTASINSNNWKYNLNIDFPKSIKYWSFLYSDGWPLSISNFKVVFTASQYIVSCCFLSQNSSRCSWTCNIAHFNVSPRLRCATAFWLNHTKSGTIIRKVMLSITEFNLEFNSLIIGWPDIDECDK